MFQQADWGQDVPKTNIKFAQKVLKQKNSRYGEVRTKKFTSILSPIPSTEKAGIQKKLKKTPLSASAKVERSMEWKKTHNNAKGDFVQNPALISYLTASGMANKKNSSFKMDKTVDKVFNNSKAFKTIAKDITNSKPLKPFEKIVTNSKTVRAVENVFTNSKAVDTNQLPKKRGRINLKDGERLMEPPVKKMQNQNDKNFNYHTDKLDELYLNFKNAKAIQAIKEDQETLFREIPRKPAKIVKSLTPDTGHTPYILKHGEMHKERLKKVLELGKQRSAIRPKNNLRQKMMDKLKAAQFRYLNEKLYTSTGSEAKQLFAEDPQAFDTYHEGYQQQLKKWPINPVEIIIKKIMKLPKSMTIADMGCGEAMLAKRVPHCVKSFDLIAKAPGVEACDMAHTRLQPGSVDVAVYCLSLMGTDLTGYLTEANRILSNDGLLLIAEVESRFDDVDSFARDVQKLGFKLLKINKSYKVFYFLEFKKVNSLSKKSKRPKITLKPCLYKRR